MPIAFHTNKRIWVSLDIDKELPEDTRPAFHVRFITERERDSISDAFETAKEQEKQGQTKEARQTLADAIALATVGWRHMPAGGEYVGAASLLDVLTLSELVELQYLILRQTAAEETDVKKAFASQPSSPGANSAEAVLTQASA